MKNIAIVEICSYTHYSSVLSRVDLFQGKGVNITVYANRDVFSYLEEEIKSRDVNFIVQEEGQSTWLFLKKIEGMKFDHIHITSLQSKFFQFLFFNPRAEKIYVHIHNVNSWFKVFFTINPKEFIKNLVRKIWLHRATGVTVGIEPMKKKLREYGFAKPVICVPFTLFYPDEITDEKLQEEETKRLSVGIPGMVTQCRRDYIGVLRALIDLPEGVKSNIRVEFIGPYVSEEGEGKIKELVSKLKRTSIQIVTHEEPLTKNEFTQSMSKSDILLGPCIIETGDEVYGITKESGFGSDLIRSRLPGVIPHELNIQEELETSIFRYKDSEELRDLLIDLINDQKKISKYTKQAKENSKKFSKEEIRKRLSINDF